MRRGAIGACLAIGLLAGCASQPPAPITVAFDRARARSQLAPGNNEISGIALLWLSSGGVVSCAGEYATLYPATAYAREWARRVYEPVELERRLAPPDFFYRPDSQGAGGPAVDTAFLETSRAVSCDADGHFHFGSVADGEYYLVAKIVWQPHLWDEHNFYYGNRYHDLAGSVMKKIRVRGGQKATANLKWSVPNSRWNLW